MATTELTDESAQQALLELDQASQALGAALQKCADHVQAGVLNEGIVMAKVGELAGQMMGGPTV